MLADRIEAKWIDVFADVFARCRVAPGDACAILSESQSRALNVQLAELALARLGARTFHVVVPTPRQTAPVAVRSTGASVALQGLKPAIAALASSAFVVDCTVEGLMHAVELPEILKGGARVLYVSNEHPEVLERLAPSPADEQKVRAGMRLLRAAREMQVTSPAGTELTVRVAGARVGGCADEDPALAVLLESLETHRGPGDIAGKPLELGAVMGSSQLGSMDREPRGRPGQQAVAEVVREPLGADSRRASTRRRKSSSMAEVSSEASGRNAPSGVKTPSAMRAWTWGWKLAANEPKVCVIR